MSQYDLAKFLAENKEEIRSWIADETSHFYYCERIFNDQPGMFHEIMDKAEKQKLKEFILKNFDINPEELSLLLTEEISNIIL